jgi:hypothetical protein
MLLLASFFDDARGILALWRLAVHLAAAVLPAEHGLLVTATVTLAISWMAKSEFKAPGGRNIAARKQRPGVAHAYD